MCVCAVFSPSITRCHTRIASVTYIYTGTFMYIVMFPPVITPLAVAQAYDIYQYVCTYIGHNSNALLLCVYVYDIFQYLCTCIGHNALPL